MKLLRFLKSELASEAHGWIADGIVKKEQAEQILSRYGTSLDQKKTRTTGSFVLAALALFFFGLALILVISKNWDEIPRAVRMGSLLIITLSVNGYGAWLYSKGREVEAKLAFFFGSISYGASIFLIAQIYHLGAYYPDGVFYWALGILPLLFLIDSLLNATLLVVLSTLWLCLESSSGYFPWMFPVFAIPLFWFLIKKKYSLFLFLGTLISSIIWIEELVRFYVSVDQHYGSEHIFLTASIFILLYGVGASVMRSTDAFPIHDYGLATRLWSLRFIVLGLLAMSFSETWEELMRGAFDVSGVIIGLNLALFGGAAFITFRESYGGQNRAEVIQDLAPFFVMVGYFALVSLLTLSAYSAHLPEVGQWGNAIFAAEHRGIIEANGTIAMLITNVALLVAGIWMIYSAFESGSGAFFYSGVGVIIITALIRYFDSVGGYLGSAFILAFAGAVLYFASHTWKNFNTQRQEISS